MRVTDFKKKILIILLFGLLIATVIGLGLLHIGSADESKITAAFEKEYYLGTELLLPNIRLEHEGKEYNAEIVVICPNGSSYRGNYVKLDQLGIYTIEYRAKTDGGKYIYEKYRFETIDELYTLGENSSVAYGGDSSQFATGRVGLNLSLKEGDVFRYNEVIDLNELGKDQSFIELFVTPSQGAGVRDVGRLAFRLEDAQNPSNYVTIYAQSVSDDGGGSPWWSNATYILAGAGSQTPSGIEWGEPMIIHTGAFGSPVQFSMYGNYNFQNSVGKETFSLRYDPQEKRLYGNDSPDDQYVIDFDSTKFFANLWEGFSTNKVYLSVWAENYLTDTADFVITKIGNSDLSVDVVRDRKPPSIILDSDGYDLNNLPEAAVGLGYPVFEAEARDAYADNVAVTTKVFYNYGSTTRYEVPIADNRFVPQKAGIYTVEYKSVDYADNISTLTYQVICIDKDAALGLGLSKDIITEGKTGEELSLFCPTTEGGIGRIDVSQTVLFAGNEVAQTENGFIPMQSGDYTVIYQAVDMAGQTASAEYVVSVLNNEEPVFLTDAALPKYLVADVEYRLPELQAYDFNVGEYVKSEIFVTDENGTEKIENNLHTFASGASGNAIVAYRAAVASGIAEKSYTIPVISAYNESAVDKSALFYSEMQKSVVRDGVQLTNMQAGTRSEFEFVLPLYAETFNAVFLMDENVAEMSLSLRGKNGSLNVEFKRDTEITNKLIVFVEGVETSLYADARNVLTFGYNNADSEITFGSGTVSLRTILPSFKAFDSEGVYFGGMVTSASQGGSVTIMEINGQSLTEKATDRQPTVIMNGEYRAKYDKGEIIQTASLRAFDVLSAIVTSKISIKAPDASYALTTDGIEISALDASASYDICLNSYGIYVVSYEICDVFGNKTEKTFEVKISDSVAPIITLKGENPTNGALNEEIIFYKADVSDDVTSECKNNCFVVNPQGMFIPVYEIKTSETENSYSFKPAVEGDWKIVYFAMDSAGNTSTIEHVIHIV